VKEIAMSQITRPGALPATAREAEQLGRCYAQAVIRAEAMRRAEILAGQDRLIAAIVRPFASLFSRLKLHTPGLPTGRAYSAFMKSGSGTGAGAA